MFQMAARIIIVVPLLFLCSTLARAQTRSSQPQDASDSGAVVVLPSEPNQLKQRIAELIEQLGDPSYQKRVNAEWELQQLGLTAFEQLRQAAIQHPVIEVANAAKYLIQSQDVIWYLETDSVDVRGYLNGYDTLDPGKRIERVKFLGIHGTPDALQALGRLARYESYEHVSKEAALSLMQALTDAKEVEPPLLDSIRQTLGASDRPSVTWIQQMLADMNSPGTVDLDGWKKLATAELRQPQPEDRGQSNLQLLDFFTRVCVWIRVQAGSEAALDVARPSMQLLEGEQDTFRLGQFATRILDEWRLPELLPEFAVEHSESFSVIPELGFYLAEGYLQLGQTDRAETQAALASKRIESPPDKVKELSKQTGIDGLLLVSNRRSEAERLAARGMFDWAEIEYRKALEAGAGQFEAGIRQEFAEFYWLGSENRKAADLLQPLAKSIEEMIAKEQQAGMPDNPNTRQRSMQEVLAERSNQSILSTYYFYDGLAQIEAGEDEAARQSLRKAIQAGPSNPDFVIAMRRVATNAEFQAFYDQTFSEMVDRFRRAVVFSEERLAGAQDREQRRQSESDLASNCNQLAWLLGKCQSNPDEAVRLSQRSLELSPDDPAYLDTLGRCYFSAGQIDKAIESQKRAVELSPHDRLMRAQLDEFEQAKSSIKRQ